MILTYPHERVRATRNRIRQENAVKERLRSVEPHAPDSAQLGYIIEYLFSDTVRENDEQFTSHRAFIVQHPAFLTAVWMLHDKDCAHLSSTHCRHYLYEVMRNVR
ncbi:MAG: hypothetical protein WAS27_03305 [Candidatus Saccharimonadales bacterium]